MKELTFEEFCALPMQYTQGMSFDWGAMRLYRNNETGVQKEIVTERMVKGDIYSGWKPQEAVYFLDGDGRQFEAIDQLYVAYMEKVCGVSNGHTLA